MSVIIDSDNNNVNITEEPINVTVSLGGPDVAAVWGGITGDLADQEDLQAALDDKVPYTGATGDVNLGEYGVQLGNLEFDNTPTNLPTAAGSVYWSDTDGTLNMVLKGGQTISRIGETQHIRALNNTGTQIARGKVVYVVGAQGQRLTIALADADTEILSKDTIGFTSEAIADGAEGFVIVQGVINNISTTGMSDGATVYLSQTAGGYTTTPPVDPAHLVVLGFIVNGGSGGAGSIYVKVDNGYELGELHDVNTTGATNGQVLTYNGTTWVPTTNGSGTVTSIATSAPITGGTITTSGTIGITQAGAAADGYLSATDWNTFNNKQAALTNPITGTGTSGQVAYWSGTGTQTGSANLVFDGTRLGIGRTPTARRVEMQQAVGSVAAAFGIFDSSGTVQAVMGTETASTTDFQLASVAALRFYSGSTIGNIVTNPTNERLRITSGGNVLINNTDGTGRLTVRGSGTTSATTALLVQNSTPTAIMACLDNRTTWFGSTTSYDGTVEINLAGHASRLMKIGAFEITQGAGSNWTGQGIQVDGANRTFQFNISNSNTTDLSAFTFNGGSITAGVGFSSRTSGTINWLLLNNAGFSPTSGNAVFNQFTFTGTINQTGGANGITRGLYVNPTLTSAADWRSIETSNNIGWAVYAGGTANSYFGGSVGIGTNAPTKTLTINTSNVNDDGIILRSSTGLPLFSVTKDGASNNTAELFQYSGGNIRLAIRSTGNLSYFNGGNFAFGTTTATGALLTVRGSGTTSATTALLVQNSTPSELFKVLDNGAWNFNGDGIVKGSGNTTSTTAFAVQNSDGSNIIRVRNDRNILIDGIFNFGNNMQIYPVNAGGYAYSVNATELRFETTFSGGVTTGDFAYQFGSFQLQNTSNANPVGVNFTSSFNPTSGTQTFTANRITPTINQTGGASGITRGLYVNPTLTSAADWRGIESVAASNANHTLIKLRNATVDVFTVKADSKIGFFNATPVAQPTTGIAEAAFVENSGGTAVNVDSTFAGYTLQQIAQALKDYGLLA